MKTINIFIGTKAQFIKVAPIIQELQKQGIPFRLIDSCQHKNITDTLRSFFHIQEPDAILDTGFTNINTIPRAFRWVCTLIRRVIFERKKLLRELFQDNVNGICLIHGDTLSTLVGLIIAKRCGLKVGHLESGLCSFHPFDPFPEELIRRICMKYSNYLFAPSQWALNNILHMKVKGMTFNVGSNTIFDTISFTKRMVNTRSEIDQPYALMSIHRFENIYFRRRLRFAIDLARRIARKQTLVFIMHQPTQKQLIRTKLLSMLSYTNIRILMIVSYEHFFTLLRYAEFVVTDGGSIQEECYYLDIPCLLLRKRTERQYGLKENVCLSRFKRDRIDYFLDNYRNQHRYTDVKENHSSKEIVRILQTLQWI